MLNPFRLYYIPEFFFENGRSKSKFCIPVAVDSDNVMLFYLPSSQVYVPDYLIKDGCMKYNDRNIHCFSFKEGVRVTKDAYSFSKRTFIYFERRVQEVSVQRFMRLYGNSVVVHGALLENLRKELIRCIVNCPVIARKVKRRVGGL